MSNRRLLKAFNFDEKDEKCSIQLLVLYCWWRMHVDLQMVVMVLSSTAYFDIQRSLLRSVLH